MVVCYLFALTQLCIGGCARPCVCRRTCWVGLSYLFSLLAWTKRLNLQCWGLVCIQWLAVQCSHLHNYAFDIAPDNASGDGLVVLYFGCTPASCLDQAPEIKVIVFCMNTMVDCQLFAFAILCVGYGARSRVCRRTCCGVLRIYAYFWSGPSTLN